EDGDHRDDGEPWHHAEHRHRHPHVADEESEDGEGIGHGDCHICATRKDSVLRLSDKRAQECPREAPGPGVQWALTLTGGRRKIGDLIESKKYSREGLLSGERLRTL